MSETEARRPESVSAARISSSLTFAAGIPALVTTPETVTVRTGIRSKSMPAYSSPDRTVIDVACEDLTAFG
jgi:hypothetical protein